MTTAGEKTTSVFFGILAAFCLFQCGMITYHFSLTPTSTREVTNTLTNDVLGNITLCLRGVWAFNEADASQTQREKEELAYLMAFNSWERNRYESIPKLDYLYDMENLKEVAARLNVSNENIWRKLQKYHNATCAVSLENKEKSIRKIFLTPTIARNSYVCGSVPWVRNMGYEKSYTSYGEESGLSLLNRPSYFFRIPQSSFDVPNSWPLTMSFSLHRGGMAPLMEDINFNWMEPLKNLKWGRYGLILVKTQIKKQTRLNTKGKPCIALTSKETFYPANFRQRVCEKKCESMAFIRTFNCSTLASFPGAEDKIYANFPACNRFVVGNQTNHTYQSRFPEIVNITKECAKLRKCHEKMFCTSWDFRSSVERSYMQFLHLESGIVKEAMISTKDYRSYVITMVAEDTYQTTVEHKTMLLEDWFSGIGGTTGFWIGASIHHLVTYAVWMVAATRKRLAATTPVETVN